jgi:hypothetical protein
MPRTLPRRVLGKSSLYLALLAGLSCFGALGCPGTLDPALLRDGGGTGTGGTGAACDAVPILMAKCGTESLCHDATGMNAAGLNLVTAPFDRLVGMASPGAFNSQCAGNTTPYLVADTNPATGLLLDKLKPDRPCGETMPTLGSVNATEVECIKSWATGLTAP